MRVLLIALLAAISYAQTAPSSVDIEIFNLMNDLRSKGFTCPDGTTFAPNPTPQQFDCRLWKASFLHSADMGTKGYFSHTSQDGRSPWDRAGEQGISAGGENIAAGNSAAQNTLNQWINSNGHCKNIGNPDFTLNAVARAVVSGSPFTNYWTQMMARSSQMPPDTSCLGSGSSTTGLPGNAFANYQNMGSGECVDANAVRPRGCFGNSNDPATPISANQPAQCEQFCSQESSCFAFEAGVGTKGKNIGVGFCDILVSNNFMCPTGWNSGNTGVSFVGPVQGTNAHSQYKTCYRKNAASTTAAVTTTTTQSGSPACEGDHSSWRSNWGTCPSYVAGHYNHHWCDSDIGRDGRLAQNVCPQCEVCTASAETKVGVPSQTIGEAMTKDDLQTENQKLRKANAALRQALRTLQNN